MEFNNFQSSKLKIGLLVLVLLLVATAGIWYVLKKNTPAEKQAKENAALMLSVSKLMLLPEEQPIIATINQSEVLIKEQAFYAGSRDGDKLIIFPKAHKAVIYSPSRKIIVNVGPFTINQGTPPPTTKK